MSAIIMEFKMGKGRLSPDYQNSQDLWQEKKMGFSLGGGVWREGTRCFCHEEISIGGEKK